MMFNKKRIFLVCTKPGWDSTLEHSPWRICWRFLIRREKYNTFSTIMP